MSDDRPSYLDVDTRIARRDPSLAALRGDPEWDAHLAATTATPEIPAWVLSLDRPRRRPWGWLVALLAVGLVLLVALPRDPYVGVKGATALLVHVRREGVTDVWDGRPLRAGDQLRIELADPAQPWYAVLYVEPDEPPMLLATGTEEGLLDGAWTLDAPPVGARLIVVGAERALSDRSPEELLALPHDAELSLR